MKSQILPEPETEQAMLRLLEERNRCRLCMEKTPGQIHNGADKKIFQIEGGDTRYSYWSNWLGDTQPELLVVGQDFGGTSYIRDVGFVDVPQNDTNNFLRELLAHGGFPTRPSPLPDRTSGVYLTNSILCIKNGGLAASVRPRWAKTCGSVRLPQLYAVLKPRIVVALGSRAWMAVRKAFHLAGLPDGVKKVYAKETHWTLPDGTLLFCMGHPSRLGRITRKAEDQVKDWRRLRDVSGLRMQSR